MQEDPSLPDWLTGLTREEARASTPWPQDARASTPWPQDARAGTLRPQDAVMLPPETGARPQEARDLSWLDEVAGTAADHPAPSVNPATAQPRAFAHSHKPRVARVSSSPAAQDARAGTSRPQDARAGTSRPQDTATPISMQVSSPPPATGLRSGMLGRFAFRRLPAWWQSLSERRPRAGAPQPDWLRE